MAMQSDLNLGHDWLVVQHARRRVDLHPIFLLTSAGYRLIPTALSARSVAKLLGSSQPKLPLRATGQLCTSRESLDCRATTW
eukprot:985218-Pleurochrysis_carterae.AAC.2